MDAITLLKKDHETVENLFKQFEESDPSDSATRRKLVDQMIEELAVHSAIEEQVFYPAVREDVPDTEDEVLEGLEEHHIVKWTLAELKKMDPDHERFTAKVTVLMESVRHHVEEEEEELFTQVTDALDAKRLEQIGGALELAKTRAPAEPQPAAPDTPPGNVPVD